MPRSIGSLYVESDKFDDMIGAMRANKSDFKKIVKKEETLWKTENYKFLCFKFQENQTYKIIVQRFNKKMEHAEKLERIEVK